MNLPETRRVMKIAMEKNMKDYLAMDKQIIKDTISYLKNLQSEVRSAMISADGFDLAHLNSINAEINSALIRFQNKLITTVKAGQVSSWDLGIRAVDDPLLAAQIHSALPLLSDTQLVMFQNFSVDLITGITNDARQSIRNQIQLSMVGDKNIYDTAKIIDRIIGTKDEVGVTAKAVKIARTELGRVNAAGSQLRMEQAKEQVPSMKKQWVTGNNPRDTHKAADGQVVEVDEPFMVGGYEADYPRDPGLPAEEVVNCNCIHVPFFEEAPE